MNKRQSLKEQRRVLVSIVVLAVLTIIGLAVVATVASQQSNLTPASRTSVVNLRGETVCLPKKDHSGPQTAECAYGLKVSDSVHYALAQVDQSVGTGEQVTVTGILSAADEDTPYDTAGTIRVDDIQYQR